ncbi:2-dehydropantoate 2-reductase, partial [Candidatus Palibaumannia cicadellinicola]
MKVTVLGCGALGQLWLAAFYCQKHRVQGWLRVPKPFCTVNIINQSGAEKSLQLPANNAQLLADSELLLVTLKAWQVSKEVRKLLPQLRSDCVILLIHNGLGTKEELPELVQPLLLGTTTHAAYSQNGNIYHISAGITSIGPGNVHGELAYQLSEVLHNAQPKVTWH